MKQRLTKIFLVALLMCGFLPHASAAAASPASLVISELQTSGLSSGTTNGRLEFVELVNLSATPVDLDGWQLNYYGGTGDITGTSTRLLATLQGTVAAGGYVLIASPDFITANPSVTVDVSFDAASTTTSSSGWLAQGGGAVQLTGAGGTTLDAVSWGTAKQNGTWWKAPEIPAGNSITRVLPADHNTPGSVFAAPGQPSPQGGGLQPAPVPASPVCSGLALSEILPNAAGTDTGHEFIEVYNPTNDPIHMLGCSLQLGSAGKRFALPDALLEPGTYRAFTDGDTGITLPNATGDTVWLHTADDDQGVRYPDAMPDDTAWALINGTWQATTKPTPNAPNELAPEDAGGQGSGTDADELAPCPAGKERNPATNRCRTITATSDAITPCQPGQTRNPQTNRCRSVLAASTTSLTPCKPGQERNPDTHRCRSIAQPASSLKPCAPGQERSPSTNRCRKAANGASFAKTQSGTTSSSTASKLSWLLAGLAVLGAAGYGVYEWRADIRRATRSLHAKFKRTASPS